VIGEKSHLSLPLRKPLQESFEILVGGLRRIARAPSGSSPEEHLPVDFSHRSCFGGQVPPPDSSPEGPPKKAHPFRKQLYHTFEKAYNIFFESA
jgi:hypothetical protein